MPVVVSDLAAPVAVVVVVGTEAVEGGNVVRVAAAEEEVAVVAAVGSGNGVSFLVLQELERPLDLGGRELHVAAPLVLEELEHRRHARAVLGPAARALERPVLGSARRRQHGGSCEEGGEGGIDVGVGPKVKQRVDGYVIPAIDVFFLLLLLFFAFFLLLLLPQRSERVQSREKRRVRSEPDAAILLAERRRRRWRRGRRKGWCWCGWLWLWRCAVVAGVWARGEGVCVILFFYLLAVAVVLAFWTLRTTPRMIAPRHAAQQRYHQTWFLFGQKVTYRSRRLRLES
jgi:hypothetical protein